MQPQPISDDPGGSLAAVGSVIVVIGIVAYFLELASVDVASGLGGDTLLITLIALGGVLFVAGLLRGSAGGGSDGAA
jgi:hypothetical protein